MNAAIRQFSACIKIAELLNELSIPGIKEYVNYILTAYRESEKIFEIVRKYADKIHKSAKEAQKTYSSSINNPSSVYNATKLISMGVSTDNIIDTMSSKKK